MIIVRICGDLSIEDGSVNTGLSVEGVIANYTCDVGFELVGNVERVCQSNGLWSGMNPACQGMNLSKVITGHNSFTYLSQNLIIMLTSNRDYTCILDHEVQK